MDQPRVLVVDDDRNILRLVRMALDKAGIRAECVDSAQDGLSKMEKYLYPVVVLDIHMPDMGGVDMLRALKQRNSLVQVIMLTADASGERIIECMDQGASDFHSKTGDLHPMVAAVAEALGRAARWMSSIGGRVSGRKVAMGQHA